MGYLRGVLFFTILALWLGFNSKALATSFEVIPLDRSTEKVLLSSALSPYVVSIDHTQKEFHKKTVRAYKKMSLFFDFNKVDALDFIYDSHFLTETAFFSRYTAVPKPQLIKARQVAAEVYSK